MKDFNFDSENFTKTVIVSIQPDLEAIDAIKDRKKAIAHKIIDNKNELQELLEKKQQLSNANDLIADSFEAHESRLEKLAKIENRRQGLVSFIDKLSNAEIECDKDIEPAKKRLFETFRNSVSSYVLKERCGIIDMMEKVVNEDNICHESVLNLYNKIISNAQINTNDLGFGFHSLTSRLYPMHGHLAGIKTMIEEARKAEIN